MGSKIWLCRELEKLAFKKPASIWILGGWYGTLASLLLTRERIPVGSIRSFDLDPEACRVADLLNENWVWRDWQFKAICRDANSLDFRSQEYGPQPDLVINTATEHFNSNDWFAAIPTGTLVALQSNDMPHEEHVGNVASLDDFARAFPLTSLLQEGELLFNYPDWSFRRFQRIGIV